MMVRFRCGACGHMLRRRSVKSDGKAIYCPSCGALVYKPSKPLNPPKAKNLKKTVMDNR